MDKIYLKMLEGSTYIYRTEPWVEKPTKYEVGDYLLSDLETIVKQSELTEDQKADVVGICIGENPVNHKNVFWYVDCFSTSDDDGTFVKDGYHFLSTDSDSTHWYRYDTGNLLLKDGTVYQWRKFLKDPTSMPAQEDVAGICVAVDKDTEYSNSLILLGKCNASLINAGNTTTTFYATQDPDHDTYSDDGDMLDVLTTRKASVLATLSGENLTTYTQAVDKFEALGQWCNDHYPIVVDYAFVASVKPALEMHNALINNQNFIRMATAHPWLYDFLETRNSSTLCTISLSDNGGEYTPESLGYVWYELNVENGALIDNTDAQEYNNFGSNCYIYTYASNNDDESDCKIEDGILNVYYKEEDNGKNPWKPDMDVNIDVITGMPGYITSTKDYNNWDADEHPCVNDFAGKQNTIEWYKQMTAAGYNVATDMPALKALMDINGVESLDDDFDGWFLGSTGYMNLIASFWGSYSTEKSAEAQELRNKFNTSLKNLNLERFADSDDPLDDLNYTEFWGSTFYLLGDSYSDNLYVSFYLGGGDISDGWLDNEYSLFAIIER